jgi:hypothetical protein
MLRIKPLMVVASLLVAGTAVLALPSSSEAGRVGGPLVRELSIAPGQYEVFMVRFEGGKLAKVGVQNAGSADLDIRIVDPASLKVLAQDLRTNNDARAQFVPTATKEYMVIVHNYTKNKGAEFVLFTN